MSTSPQTRTLSYELNLSLPAYMARRNAGKVTDPQWDEFREVLTYVAENLALGKWTRFTIEGRARKAGATAQAFQRAAYPRSSWVFTTRVESDDVIWIARIQKPVPSKRTVPAE